MARWVVTPYQTRGPLARAMNAIKQGHHACTWMGAGQRIPADIQADRSRRMGTSNALGTRYSAVTAVRSQHRCGSSISAVRFEQSAHHGSTWCVSAGQRLSVVRGGVEPPTFRFSGGRSYQLSYLTLAVLTGFEPATFTLTG
jgi:hypothetical protein